MSYSFKLQYVNTESFAYVDVLSRLISQQNFQQDDEFVVASIKLEKQILQVIDSNLQAIPVNFNQLVEAYANDEIMNRAIEYISTNWNGYSSSSEPQLKHFFNRRTSLSVSNGVILFGDRVVIPEILRAKIIQQLHKGHPGIVRMKHLARSYVYWPKIDQEIENFVKFCTKCAVAGKSPIKTLLHSWPTPNKIWERVHIDYAGPFKNAYYLFVIDAFSKWPEIIKTESTTSTQTIKILTTLFSRFGTPEQIVSDNGRQFVSEQFQSYCNSNGIEHLQTSPYTPMSNGQAERFVDTFKRSIKKMENERNLDENIQIFLFNYRSTPNENLSSNKSPAEVFLGRKLRTMFNLLHPTSNRSTKRNAKMEEQFNTKHGAKDRKFNIGDKVFVQIHHGNTWRWEEGEIISKIGNVNYMVKIEDRSIQAHTNQLKHRYSADSPGK